MTLGMASGALPIIPLSFIGKVPVGTPTTLTVDKTTTPFFVIYGYYGGSGNASMEVKLGGNVICTGGSTASATIGIFAYDSVADVWQGTIFSSAYGTNLMFESSGAVAGSNTLLITPTNCGALVYGINIR